MNSLVTKKEKREDVQVLEKYLRETELSFPISNIRGMRIISIDAAGMVISKNSSIKVKNTGSPSNHSANTGGRRKCVQLPMTRLGQAAGGWNTI